MICCHSLLEFSGSYLIAGLLIERLPYLQSDKHPRVPKQIHSDDAKPSSYNESNDGMFVEPKWFLLTTDSTHQLHLTAYVASGD